MTNPKIAVSVLVPIKNEAINLSRCLKSVQWADEILVVDSQSNDGSEDIAKSLGAQVFQFKYLGVGPKKKNWALDNLPFSNDWVFILDADEVLPPKAEDEIRRIVSGENAGGNEIVGYWVNRRLMFMGKWLKHCYYPNWNLRLFKHKLGRYEKLTNVDTASGDNEVHEHVIVKGATSRLQFEMDHYAFPSVQVFVEKHNRYSNWEATVATSQYLQDSANKLQIKEVAQRRILKTLVRNFPCRPLLRFLYIYILQGGFLDGKEGFYFACLHSFYEFLIVAKTYELQKQQKQEKQISL